MTRNSQDLGGGCARSLPRGQTDICWGIGDSERCAANNGGSTLFRGEGRTPRVTYTQLPPLNGAFGKKDVIFSSLDLDVTMQSPRAAQST